MRAVTFRSSTLVAVAAWLVTLTTTACILILCEDGEHLPLINIPLGIALTTTALAKLGRPLATVEESFRLGYDAGYADGRRCHRLEVVEMPQERVARMN